jgi:molybdate transport system regulatory protein
LTIRIDLSASNAVGPGKVRLLELIHEKGSISAAGRAMHMSYRRAWLLIDELNRIFNKPSVVAEHGGRAGGGAKLTPFGQELVRRYRQMERDAHAALSKHLTALDTASREPSRSGTRRKSG